MLKSSVQHKILKTLPDDRPITAIQIVENIEKCPGGFYPICRTYDQDQDADLRESSIFKSSSARYLCLSKTEGLPNFVVQELRILTEKNNLPKGFSLLNRTADSEQRAWKKKQLCYRLVNLKETKTAITDIILCNRLKKAPLGFNLAGELNGVTICYKMGNVESSQQSPESNGNGNSAPTQPNRPPPPSVGGVPTTPMYPPLNTEGGDYEILKPPYPVGPTRPAPRPPAPVPQHSTQTLGQNSNALDGVPFIINPRFMTSSNGDKFQFPVIKAKTLQQIIKEYDYPFTIERQTLT